MIIDEIRAIQSSRRDLRNFGLVVGAVLLLLAAFLFWKEKPAWPWLGGIGACLAGLGLLLPSVLLPLQKVWMTLAVLMGWVMTRVILSILYFLVLTPIALGAKAIGKRFFDQRHGEGADSCWRPREDPSKERERYERQY